jgi:menaquinone-dependent protoporphyrinogen oxidase
MPRILIVYGTTDGHTAKICYFLASEMMRVGAEVDLLEAGTRSAEPGGHDAVIVAASVHAQGHQRSIIRWVREHEAGLTSVPNAFISVCLGVLQKEPRVRRDLDRIQERFRERTGWRPDQVQEVAGALKYTSYGWLKRMVMRYIAGRAGGSTDTSRDHEYTDWTALREFAWSFVAALPAPQKGIETYQRSRRYEMAARSEGTMDI